MGAAVPRVVTSTSASGAQVIDGSSVFNGDDQYLTKTFASAGNRQTFTFSFWVKRSEFGVTNMGIFSEYPGSGNGEYIRFSDDDSGDTFRFFSTQLSNQSLVTKRKFRDTGWYHICVVVDTNEATNTDRVKIYINSERNVDWASATWPNQYAMYDFMNATAHYIGRCQSGTYLPGYLSQFYVIDGQALGPENFGYTDPLTNTWRSKKFNQFTDPLATQYSGASTLTWDDSPIGSIYTLSNGNKTATAGGGGSGYSNADVWSIALAANTTYAWTLDITNGDSTGGWYFTDSQTDSGTHADERGGNSLGMRPGETHAGYYGTFATANGGSDGQDKISMPGASPGPGFARVDFVVYRPASGTGKVWVKNNGSSSWVGGGDPSNTSSTPSFIIPDGTTYFGLTFYDRSSGDQIATLDGDGSIQQKIGGNSFYLPLDGNSLIGKDQSGKGNDWTPVKFGGSNVIPKATGALPILSTQSGGRIATVGVRTDAHAANLVLALPLVGDALDVSNQINSGSTTKTVTTTAALPRSNPDAPFYDGSYYFDGTGDYLSTPDSADYSMGSGDFTVEMWINPAGASSTGLLIAQTSGALYGPFNFFWNSGVLELYSSSNGSTWQISGLVFGTPPANKWSHVALTRSGNTFTTFLNGVIGGTTTNSDPQMDATGTLQIGARNATDFYTGYIQDVRIYKGVAKYTTDFILASANPTILSDTSSGVALGSELTKLSDITTEGSVSFPNITANNDRLEIADNADWTFGSGDFTMECFAYIPTPIENRYESLAMKYTSSDKSWFWSIYSYAPSTTGAFASGTSAMNFYFYYSGGSSVTSTTPYTIRQNAWSHLAVVRDGNTVRLYVNGVQGNTIDVTGLTMDDSAVPLKVGVDGDNNYDTRALISNLRIVKGTCLYPSGTSFVPSTEPLTNVTNTKLLCCQSPTSATTAAVTPSAISATGVSASYSNPFMPDDINTVMGPPTGYATLNPLMTKGTLTDGNLTHLGSTEGNSASSIKVSSGKWYAEVTLDTAGHLAFGWTYADSPAPGWIGADARYYIAYNSGTVLQLLPGGSSTLTSGTGTIARLIPFQMCLDLDNNKAYIGDGVTWFNDDWNQTGSPGNPLTGENPTFTLPSGKEWYFFIYANLNGASKIWTNFGQKPLKYAPPEGYKLLNYANLPSPGVVRPDNSVVGVGTYIGNGLALANTAMDASTAYRYHRILFEGDAAGGSVSELEFYDFNGDKIDASDPNNAGGTVATNATQGLDGWTAFNGTRGGADYSQGVRKDAGVGSAGFYISKDWGSGQSKIVYSIKVWGVNSYGLAGNTASRYLKFEGSNDNASWTTLQTWNSARYGSWTTSSSTEAGHVSDQSNQINVGFAPDLVWIKRRNGANYHHLFDSVRGNDKTLYLPDTFIEDPFSYFDFNSKGFTIGGTGNGWNASAQTYVGWCWKAGGNKNTFNVDDVGYASAAAAGLDGGTLTVTGASVGTKQGFSIIKFTGTGVAGSVSHGLTQKPDFISAKNLEVANDWPVHHSSLTNDTYTMYWNGNALAAAETLIWPSASTDSVINVGSGAVINQSTKSTILYAWHNVPGVQKFGSYKGSELSDPMGVFVYCGFRPALIVAKNMDAAENWWVWDYKRDGFNPTYQYLEWDTYMQENSTTNDCVIDIVSNGFKIRSQYAPNNAQNYVYAAWAYQPMDNLYGAQSNAR